MIGRAAGWSECLRWVVDKLRGEIWEDTRVKTVGGVTRGGTGGGGSVVELCGEVGQIVTLVIGGVSYRGTTNVTISRDGLIVFHGRRGDTRWHD